MGNASSQLRFHIKAGINIELKTDEKNEIMLLISVLTVFLLL